jgi:predicted MFS family arabinose efflux permease
VAVLTASGSLIYPFLSPSMVTNAALPENRLSLLYLVGGAATFFSSRYFGRLSDRFGKLRVFGWLALLSAIPTLVVTNMVPSPVAVVVAVTALYMMFSSGRFVPSMAMVTASVESRYRGGFMSVNSAVQQISAGVATAGASLLVGSDAAGHIVGYSRIGLLSVVLLIVAVVLARRLVVIDSDARNLAAPDVPVEAIG